jgi:glycogen(starch) synthase
VRVLTVGNRYPPWSIGGYELLWADAVSRLRAAGHEVRVLTTLPDPSDLPAGDREPPADTHRELRWYWRDHEFPPISLRAALALERANAETFARHLESFGPDVVVWWSMGGMSLSLLAHADPVPRLGVVGDDWMAYGPRVDGWLRRWRTPPLRPIGATLAKGYGLPARVEIGPAARWLFISAYLLDGARGDGVELPDAVVAHPGVDDRLFARREPHAWSWRLLYCGRIEQRKGVDTAVQALALLPEHATLTLDGPVAEPERVRLSELAATLGVLDRVRFRLTARPQLPDVYAAADAVVFPVRWREPWGLVPLEAMAVGRPVLASRSGGGAAEYLVDRENCLGFKPGDAGELADAVRLAGADADLRSALVAAGCRTAAAFTADAFHAQLERELDRVVSGASD